MNKKLFTGIIILMGISILGIIAVQLVWMNNAIRVKNELFGRSVNDALANTVQKLEDIHNFGVVSHMVFNDSLHWKNRTSQDFDFVFETPPPPPPGTPQTDSLQVAPPTRMYKKVKPAGQNSHFEIKVEKKSNKPATIVYRSEKSSDKNDDVLVVTDKPLKTRGVVVLNSDTIFSNVDSLYNISVVKIDSMLTSLDTFEAISPDFSQRAQGKAVRLKNMATRVVTEFAQWDVHQIDEKLVRNVLDEELKNRNIPINFEFGILKDSAFISLPEENTDSLKLIDTEYRVDLYPNDIFQKNIKLAIWFPSRDSFIYRSLNWLLVSSFLFSLIILVTFGLSVFYILRQKKISEMKSDFINNMTHEFKTPIATISVATDSIVNDKVVNDPERIRYFAGMIKKENTRMNRQVEDILTIARLDKKEFEFVWDVIDVHELIKDAVQGINIQIEKRGGKIETVLNAVNPVITTDKNHCTNVIYNLLDNAVKYSSNAPEIKISTSNKPKGILISVEDKGIGMSKTVQSKIFERFYRQTTGNVHNVKGFGLGLSYSKAVIEANQGTITVQSEQGKGSRFDLFLPFIRE